MKNTSFKYKCTECGKIFYCNELLFRCIGCSSKKIQLLDTRGLSNNSPLMERINALLEKKERQDDNDLFMLDEIEDMEEEDF